jgi:hypothetical protein
VSCVAGAAAGFLTAPGFRHAEITAVDPCSAVDRRDSVSIPK